MTTFSEGDDVAAVEHDAAGEPVESGAVHYGTVTWIGPCSVRARFADEGEQVFLLDSRGRAWREGGRWRLVPLGHGHAVPALSATETEKD